VNPGSKEALAAGCRCPVIDNHYGRGVPTGDGPVFWITEGCPVHCLPATSLAAAQEERP
jgi:hypothetical protein